MPLLGPKLPVRIAAGAVSLAVPLSFAVAPAADAAPAPDIKVTQNYSDAIVAFDGVACSTTATGFVSDNQFYRRFDMSVYGAQNGFKVSKMTMGVEESSSSAGGVPGDFMIYAIDHTADLTVANLGTALASVPVDFEVASSGLVSANISAAIPAGKDMVIETSIDAASGDQVFYPGANEAAELAPSYLASTGCGITEPTALADVGPFGGIANVMFVNGKTTDCTTAEAALPAAQAAATAAAAAVTAATPAVTTATDAVAKAAKAVKKAKKALKKAKQSGNATKIKKASKKAKAAKKKAKAAKAALATATAALDKAKAAATAANAALAAATAASTTKCAQPTLPAAPRPSGSNGHASKPISLGGNSVSSSR